jgi:hypothetical protein
MVWVPASWLLKMRRATSRRSPTIGSRISYRTVVPSFRAATMFFARRTASCCDTVD